MIKSTTILIYIFIFLLLNTGVILSQSWNPEVIIKNGTTGQPGSVDGLKLIIISNGMQTLSELPGFSNKLSINNISLPDDLPVLFQVKFRGATYNKMVPPAPMFRTKPVEIIVYDTVNDLSGLDIKNVVQISREENSLRFIKVYIFNNLTNPKKSYVLTKPLEIFIPEQANEVKGQYTQSDSKMGIPLSLEKGEVGRKFDRAILPGQSELFISYTIPSNKNEITTLEDRILFEKEEGRVFLLNPPDIKIKGRDLSPPTVISESGPDGMMGIRLNYKNKIAILEIIGGNPQREDTPQERKVVNGKIFVNWINSTYGVLAILCLLISLSYIFVYKK